MRDVQKLYKNKDYLYNNLCTINLNLVIFRSLYMIYSDLSTFLTNSSADSKFSAKLPTEGGYIQFSNTSGKIFTLGLTSILTVLTDIYNNIDKFSPHAKYEEKTWRDLGAEYYTDISANAMCTVQTKPMFSTLSKIINWANGLSSKSDSNISLSNETLSKTIEKITLIIKEYTPHIEQNTNKQLIKDKKANVFAKKVLIYLNEYDSIKRLLPFLKKPNATGNASISYDGKNLTSIFRISEDELPVAAYTSGGKPRNFSDFIKNDLLNKYIYVSTEWTADVDSRLHLGDFQYIVEKLYPEFTFTYEDGFYCLNSTHTDSKKNQFSIDKSLKGSLTFAYKNILLKGVPGTGKSHLLDKIITDDNKLNLEKNDHNILRINIHSASSNADLMQGIGIATNNDQIVYKEKQGLILNHIKKAISCPKQPFVIVLEEIQENSLNELIGDLIYLIEDVKRTDLSSAATTATTYFESIENFTEEYIKNNPKTYYVEIPYLVSTETKYKKMILPTNLYIFCTSNYRDDKKVIEDNLLRRFEVIEIYPSYKETIGTDFKSQEVSNFLKTLNDNIVTHFHRNNEIHPDRFMIGHAIWMNVQNKKDFYAALLKVVTEFKDIKELDYDSDLKIILSNIKTYPFGVTHDELERRNYKELIEYLQARCYSDLFSSSNSSIEQETKNK